MKGDDFVQQVRSHKDTLTVYFVLNYASILFGGLLIKDGYSGGTVPISMTTYCNFKKYYCFYDTDTFQLDTVGFYPWRRMVIIYTKDNKKLYRDLGILKVINDSLLVEMYCNKRSLIKHFHRSIKLKDIDSVVIKIPRYEYKSKKYRYYPKENCISIEN